MHGTGPETEVVCIAVLTPHDGTLVVAADDVHDVFKPDLWGHTVHGWAAVVVAELVKFALAPQGIVENVLPGGLEPNPAVLKRPIGEIGRKRARYASRAFRKSTLFRC